MTKGAAMYLDRLAAGFDDLEKADSDSQQWCLANGKITGLFWKTFQERYFDDDEENPEFYDLDWDESVYDSQDELRKATLLILEKVIDFHTLDRLNDGTELRIVEVPDGVSAYVMEDGETGHEFVTEPHRTWSPQDTWRVSAKNSIDMFCRSYRYSPDNSLVKDGDIVYAFEEHIGVARVRKCYYEQTYNGGHRYVSSADYYYVFLEDSRSMWYGGVMQFDRFEPESYHQDDTSKDMFMHSDDMAARIRLVSRLEAEFPRQETDAR